MWPPCICCLDLSIEYKISHRWKTHLGTQPHSDLTMGKEERRGRYKGNSIALPQNSLSVKREREKKRHVIQWTCKITQKYGLDFQKFGNNCAKNRLYNELFELFFKILKNFKILNYSFRAVKTWVSLPKEAYDTQSNAWLSKTSWTKRKQTENPGFKVSIWFNSNLLRCPGWIGQIKMEGRWCQNLVPQWIRAFPMNRLGTSLHIIHLFGLCWCENSWLPF